MIPGWAITERKNIKDGNHICEKKEHRKRQGKSHWQKRELNWKKGRETWHADLLLSILHLTGDVV